MDENAVATQNTESAPTNNTDNVNELVDEFRKTVKEILVEKEGEGILQQIEEWKKANNGEIYVQAFSDDSIFIIRPLKRLEYEKLVEQYQGHELDNAVVVTATLYPKLDPVKIRAMKAGQISVVAARIMQISGFDDEGVIVTI